MEGKDEYKKAVSFNCNPNKELIVSIFADSSIQ